MCVKSMRIISARRCEQADGKGQRMSEAIFASLLIGLEIDCANILKTSGQDLT